MNPPAQPGRRSVLPRPCVSPGQIAVLLLLMGAFLGLVIPANNATVMEAVPASASAVTGGMVNVARALGTALGVAVAAMGLHMAELHNWVGPQVVLGGLAVCSIALAATTLNRPTTTSGAQRPST